MNYTRVIPRDFFNESKLLKCFGQLSLKMLDAAVPEGITIVIQENGEPFDIHLSEDGYLYIGNYPVTVNTKEIVFKCQYNSKSAYPLFCEHDYYEYPVFDDAGNFDAEFISFCHTL